MTRTRTGHLEGLDWGGMAPTQDGWLVSLSKGKSGPRHRGWENATGEGVM